MLIESTDARTTDGLVGSHRLLHVGSSLLATATTASIVRVEIEMDLMLSLNFATDNRQAGDIVTARIPKHCVEEFIL